MPVLDYESTIIGGQFITKEEVDKLSPKDSVSWILSDAYYAVPTTGGSTQAKMKEKKCNLKRCIKIGRC